MDSEKPPIDRPEVEEVKVRDVPVRIDNRTGTMSVSLGGGTEMWEAMSAINEAGRSRWHD